MQRVAVVGAGMAGARVCEELRSQGYDGSIVLVGAEPHLPYDRPPLSKGLLFGRTDDSTLPVAWEDIDVDVRLGVTATRLEPGQLSTSAGLIEFDSVVLALGAQPVRLPGDRGSAVVRTIDDARALRAALVSGASVVVIGAGWLGGEVATAAAVRGCAVTVLEAADLPLVAPLGPAVGALVVAWYAEAGIDLRLAATVAAADGDGVTLGGGDRIDGDVVLTAIGVRPALGWLTGSGLEIDDGIVTDAAGRTSQAGVYAVGDCAHRWSPRAARLVRTEHWDDALHAPAALVTAMLGGAAAYDPVPYFWSEYLGRRLQWAGWRAGDPAVWRGDPARDPDWAAAWLDSSGQLTGFLAVDRPRDLLRARKAIDAGVRPDPAGLADPDVPIRRS